MTLKNAVTHFESLVAETTKKSEIKVYQDFIQILSSLEKRDLSETEIQAIETVLDSLDINTTTAHHKKHYIKALQQFKKYLKDTFSLTTKGYYSNLGVGLGMSFGVLFGVVVLGSLERSMGISLGISLGMLIGLLIGRHLDAQAEASGMLV
jgi:hypothetical protein